MVAVDTNILVYAHRRDSPWHAAAASAVAGLAEGAGAWMIPWPCLHEFFAVVTGMRTFPRPSSREEAVRQIESWMESPTLVVEGETAGHWGVLRELVSGGKLVGGQVHDARIAAICLEHEVSELWTADRDFSRFPRLKARNPLVR